MRTGFQKQRVQQWSKRSPIPVPRPAKAMIITAVIGSLMLISKEFLNFGTDSSPSILLEDKVAISDGLPVRLPIRRCKQASPCLRIQCESWSMSWNEVDPESRRRWDEMKCREKLMKPVDRPPTSKCKNFQPAASHQRINALRDKYKNGRCVLVANGPSLNKIRWDWQDNFDVVMGMNKIYIGIERYNITNMKLYAACNPLVIEQSLSEIWGGLGGPATDKFISANSKLFPCNESSRGIHYIPSVPKIQFSTDPKIGLNEGWTVTYWSLQVLFWVGCSEVYIVGMDHNFKQTGPPNQLQKMTGVDQNHFDSSYFQGNNWHTADLTNNERHYRIANKFFNDHGRKIYDATPGGRCEIFEKVDWKTALYKTDG